MSKKLDIPIGLDYVLNANPCGDIPQCSKSATISLNANEVNIPNWTVNESYEQNGRGYSHPLNLSENVIENGLKVNLNLNYMLINFHNR